MPSSEVQMYSSIYSHQISWPCPPVTNVPCPVEFFVFFLSCWCWCNLFKVWPYMRGNDWVSRRWMRHWSVEEPCIGGRPMYICSYREITIYQCFLLHDNFLCTHMELINYHKMMFQSPNHRGELTLLLVCMLWVNCFTCAAYVCVDKFFMYVIW